MQDERPEKGLDLPAIEAVSRRGPGGRQPGAGRKPTHGAAIMRRTLRALTTRQLDGRSAVAVAVKRWKQDVEQDLPGGGDLTRAQQTLVEAAAQKWLIASTLADYIARQGSLVSKRRAVAPVVLQYLQVADSLERTLSRLGLERRARDVPDLTEYLRANAERNRKSASAASDASAPATTEREPA